MGNNFSVKSIKCDRCKRKWKTKKHDIPAIADDCPDMACDLRTSRYTKIMEILKGQTIHRQTPKEETEDIEVDDAILIKVDKNGNVKTL